jgi:cytidine deaminase
MEPLDNDWRALISAAKKVSRKAYCPYSEFPVGCAIQGKRGVYAGCNVENASYGATICAERSAMVQAIASGDRSIRRVVIYTPTDKPAAPCGPCRQVINEFNPDAEIVSVCNSEQSIRATLSTLLPLAFGPANLENAKPPKAATRRSKSTLR